MRTGLLIIAGTSLRLVTSTSTKHLRTLVTTNRHSQFPLHVPRFTCPLRPYSVSIFPMSQSTGPKPPQAPFDFTTLSPSVIIKTVSDAIAKSKALEDQVAALKADDCTFDSVVLPLALDEGDIDVQTDSATFMQSVSPDKLSRDAATESQKQLSDYSIASSMRQDIFDALQHAQQNIKDGSLDAESQRLLDRMLLDKRRAGLGLSSDKQAQYKALKQEINAKCIEFRKNCDEEAGFLTFTKEELQGVPESVMKGYEQVEDNGVVRYKVTNKTP